MPYNPQTQYRGDAYIAQGQENAWQALGGILSQQLANGNKATALRKAIDVYAPEGDAGDAIRSWSKSAGLSDLEGFIQGSSMAAARNSAMAKAQNDRMKAIADATWKTGRGNLLNEQAKATAEGQSQLGPFLQAWAEGKNQPTVTTNDVQDWGAADPMGLSRAQDVPGSGAPDVLGALLRAGAQFPAGMKTSGALVPELRAAMAKDNGQNFDPTGGSVSIPMGDGTSIMVPYLKTSKGTVKSLEEFTPDNPKYAPRAGSKGAAGDAVPLHDETGAVIGYGLPNGHGGLTHVKADSKGTASKPEGEPIYSKDGKFYWDTRSGGHWQPVAAAKDDPNAMILKMGGAAPGAPAAASYSSPDEVKAAVASGKLGKDEAAKLLKSNFGFK